MAIFNKFIFLGFLLLSTSCKDLDKPESPTNDTVANFSFNPSSCNAACSITFTNLSSGSGNLTCLWEFGDPASGSLNTSILKDPTHEYKNAGTYEVKIVVTSSTGSNEIKKSVTIGEPIVTFQKTYSGSLNEELNDIVEFSDGSFIGVGSSYDSQNNLGRALVYKINNKGEKISSYQVGDFTSVTKAHGIALTSDGGFFMGTTVAPKSGNYEVHIYKISNTDAVVSTKKFTADYIELNALHKTTDGGCVFTGVKRQSAGGKNKIWAARLDANANIMFDVTFDGWKGDDVIQTSDGGFVIAGETDNLSNKILKMSSIGILEWQDGSYSNAQYIIPYGIALSQDGSILLGGDAQDLQNGSSLYYAFAAKVKMDKTVQWYKPFGGADFNFGRSITTASNGEIVVAGLAGNGTNNDALFIKTDANGNNAVRKQFGGAKNEAFLKVIATKDGGYLMVGFSYSTSDNTQDIYAVKTDKNGNI